MNKDSKDKMPHGTCITPRSPVGCEAKPVEVSGNAILIVDRECLDCIKNGKKFFCKRWWLSLHPATVSVAFLDALGSFTPSARRFVFMVTFFLFLLFSFWTAIPDSMKMELIELLLEVADNQ